MRVAIVAAGPAGLVAGVPWRTRDELVDLTRAADDESGWIRGGGGA